MELVHGDDQPGTSLDEPLLDRKKDLPLMQNFSGKLIIHAEIGSLRFTSMAPDKFLMFVVFKFSHDRPEPLAVGSCSTQTMDTVEGDFIDCFFWDFNWSLMKVFRFFSGSSPTCSRIPEMTRLSLVLQACRSSSVSLICLPL